jgi:hypothetical protein
MVKVPRRDCVRISGAKYADEAFPDLYQGMSEFALTSGRFSTVDLLHYILEFTGDAYVDCASWCGSYGTMRSVHDFLTDGNMLGFRMIMDGGFENARKGFCAWVDENIGDVIALVPNHAKFCAIYNESWSFVVETSANLTKSVRTEHYRVTEDPDFCSWVVDYFDEIFELKAQKGGRIFKEDLADMYR